MATRPIPGTNFNNALDAAMDLWARAPQPESGCADRVMLLLTDGGAADGIDREGAEYRAYVNTKISEAQERVTPFLMDGGVLYVTGISGSDEPTYWHDWGPGWSEVAHNQPNEEPVRVTLVGDQATLGSRMSKIVFASMKTIIRQIPTGEVVVPPYLQTLTLTYYKPDEKDILVLLDPNGNPISPDRQDLVIRSTGDSTPIQRLEIIKPLPGVYELATSLRQEDVIITMQMAFAQAELVGPVDPMQQSTTGLIQFRLVDNEGQPMSGYSDPRYALQVNAQVAGPERTSTLSLTSRGDGLYEGNFTPPEAGTHHLLVTATAQDERRQTWGILANVDRASDAVVDALPAGQTVQPVLVGDFVVNGVKVLVGAPANVRTECVPGQYSGLRLPLSIVNAVTEQPAKLSVPVDWDVSLVAPANRPIDVSITEAGGDGAYVLTTTPDFEGDVTLNLRATASDPQTAEKIAFFDQDVNFALASGVRADFILEALAEAVDPVTAVFENWLSPAPATRLIGRSLFFFPRPVQIEAQLLDTDHGRALDALSLLPKIVLRQEGTGQTFSNTGWMPSSRPGYFATTISVPDVGRYVVGLDPATTPCGTQIAIPHEVPLQLVPDLLERVATVLALGILLVAGYVGASFGIGKLAPLSGYLVLTSSDGKTRIGSWDLSTGQVHTFKLDPQRHGYLTRIQVRSLFGDYQVIVERLDPNTRKPTQMKPLGPFKRGTPWTRNLTTESTLRWVRNH